MLRSHAIPALLLLASLATAQRGPATSATFTNFGTPCGADLNGVVSPTLRIGLAITNAVPRGFGFVGLGNPAATPTPLPIGTCSFLLDHRMLLGGQGFVTDANGSAAIRFPRVPPAGITISFQAVVLSFDRATSTRRMDASNGTTLVTQ